MNRATISTAATWLPTSAAAVFRRRITDGAGHLITLIAGLILLAVDPSNHCYAS